MKNRIYEPFEEEYGIKNKDHDSEEYFRGAVNIAIEEYQVKPFEIADKFKISESTCDRWKKGKSFPVRSVRGIVLDRLAELVNENFGKK